MQSDRQSALVLNVSDFRLRKDLYRIDRQMKTACRYVVQAFLFESVSRNRNDNPYRICVVQGIDRPQKDGVESRYKDGIGYRFGHSYGVGFDDNIILAIVTERLAETETRNQSQNEQYA